MHNLQHHLSNSKIVPPKLRIAEEAEFPTHRHHLSNSKFPRKRRIAVIALSLPLLSTSLPAVAQSSAAASVVGKMLQRR